MKIRIARGIRRVEAEYRGLYEQSDCASPYMSYDWIRYTKKGFRDRHPFNNLFCRLRVYLLYGDSDELRCAAPLLIEHLPGKKKRVKICGIDTPAEPLDLVYPNDIRDEEFDFLLDSVIQNEKPDEFFLSPLIKDSMLARYCLKRGNAVMKDEVSYHMYLTDYDSWYGGLSKSVRQNIRTSYNRLNTDGKAYSFELTLGKPLSKQQYNRINSILSKRLMEHMDIQNPFMKAAVRFMKLLNPASMGLNNSANSYCAILYIDGDIAGYTSGLVDKGVMSVCRFAIDSAYSRYNPGALIHNELMKRVSGQDNFAVKEYIFSRGDEQYKLSYGGEAFAYARITFPAVSGAQKR